MDDDFGIPANTKELDDALHKIHSKFIKPEKDMSKDIKESLKKVLENMVSEMKQDEVFKAVYGKLCFQGSSYEKLRIGSPDEFDINLELRLPVDCAELKVETLENTPGFARVQLGRVTGKTGEQVQKTIDKWIDASRYLLRKKILSWLQSLVDKVLPKIKLETLKEIKPSGSGPAITLTIITTNGMEFSVDLVPCLVFDWKNMPANIQKKLNEKPLETYENLKWFLVPKGPKKSTSCEQYVDDENGSNGIEWRMSFYEYEKSLMNGLNGMKPTIKLIKLLRDRWHRTSVSSYYIKTIFLWEIFKKSTEFWQKKDHGYLLIYMLRVFEEHLSNKCIPFFWDERHNLVSHLAAEDMENLHNFLKRWRTKLENTLRKQDDSVKVLYGMFINEEPCVEYQGQHLVEDEKEEEEQLQLLPENERSFFNSESLVVFGIGVVTLLGVGIAAAVRAVMANKEEKGERGEDKERRRGEDKEQRRGGV